MKRIISCCVFLTIVGCAQMERVHDDECVKSCLAGGSELSLEHLDYVLKLNREALESERDEKTRDTIREIIAGIEAHIDYIKAGSPSKGRMRRE